MAQCRWALGGQRHRYATAWPDKLGTDMMAVDGIDGRRREKRWEGEEPVSRHQFQSEWGEKAG